MQHLSHGSRRHILISENFRGCQDQVRFFALHRIKPHAPPLVRAPSIHLSFNLAAVLPGGRLNALAPKPRLKGTTSKSTSFTAWSTRVSNPVCSPTLSHLSVSLRPGAAFATGIPPDLYAFHRYTWNSTPSTRLKLASIRCSSQVEPGDFTSDLTNRLRALAPSNSD